MKQNTKAIVVAIAVTVISLLINVIALAGKIKAGNMNRWDYGDHWGLIFGLLFVVEVIVNIVMFDISYYICTTMLLSYREQNDDTIYHGFWFRFRFADSRNMFFGNGRNVPNNPVTLLYTGVS